MGKSSLGTSSPDGTPVPPFVSTSTLSNGHAGHGGTPCPFSIDAAVSPRLARVGMQKRLGAGFVCLCTLATACTSDSVSKDAPDGGDHPDAGTTVPDASLKD